MPQHFVCLTFDLDNTSIAVSRGTTTPTMISRGDFGMAGTERLLQLLAKFAIPATWFIPGHTIESYPASVRAVHAAGHEIGHHGWTHRPPASLSREERRARAGARQRGDRGADRTTRPRLPLAILGS